jgi:hypothetical protein
MSGVISMVRHFLKISPVDVSFIPPVESQRKACEFLADAFPYRSGRWRDQGSLEGFPSVGDIDFNEHSEAAMVNPHYSNQTRFSITIDNHRDLLGDAELAQLRVVAMLLAEAGSRGLLNLG